MAGVPHSVPAVADMSPVSHAHLVGAMFDSSTHVGVAQFRVGTVAVTVLDTAVPVTFSSALPDSSYEVFIQPKSPVSVSTSASALTTDGFMLNLSAGVNATFSYLAIGVP